MSKRILQVVLVSFALLASNTFAQEQPDQEGVEMFEVIQQLGGQMIQNLLDKGVDPQAFFGDLQQQIKNGALDRHALFQTLVDTGIIDEKMQNVVSQAQEKKQKNQLASLQQQLGATDEEWAVLSPKIKKILNLQMALGTNVQSPQFAIISSKIVEAADLNKASQSLRSVLKNKTSDADAIHEALAVWRTAHEKGQRDLATAQKDLTEYVTRRQEAILTVLSIL
jgi:hypothetical protein